MPLRSEERIALPAPVADGGPSFEQVLRARRSSRAFSSRSLERACVAQLLWAAQGVVDPSGRRTAPSAGALYPLETHLVALRVDELAAGLYRYDPLAHTLARRVGGDLAPRVHEAALWQDAVLRAAALIALSAVPERTRARYGERALRYVWMEAGHAAQNVYLQAAALDVGMVAVGAFRDAQLARVLELGPDEVPLYLLAAGRSEG
jgi:SagB-type dehydrogenase family enzyme